MRFLDQAFEFFRDYQYPFMEHEMRLARFRAVQPFREWVRDTREARFLNLKTVAEKVQMAPSTLARIERNEAGANIKTLERIALALDCELVYGFRSKHSFAREIFDRLLPFVAHRPQENPAHYAIWMRTKMRDPRVRRELGWTPNKGGLDLHDRYFYR